MFICKGNMDFRCILLLCFCSIADALNPCLDHHYLFDNGDRSPRCETSVGQSDAGLNDHWYRVVMTTGPLKLTDSPVPNNKCGATYPIWLNGRHPTLEEDIVNRTTCVMSSQGVCHRHHHILIRNCTHFYVYYLTATHTDQRYCFDSTTGCPPQLQTTTKEATTTVSWESTTSTNTTDTPRCNLYMTRTLSSMFSCVMFIGGFLIGSLSVTIVALVKKKRTLTPPRRSTPPPLSNLPPSYVEVMGTNPPPSDPNKF